MFTEDVFILSRIPKSRKNQPRQTLSFLQLLFIFSLSRPHILNKQADGGSRLAKKS